MLLTIRKKEKSEINFFTFSHKFFRFMYILYVHINTLF